MPCLQLSMKIPALAFKPWMFHNFPNFNRHDNP